MVGCSDKFDTGKVLTKDEYKDCFTIVQITKDNWQDYFEIVDLDLTEQNNNFEEYVVKAIVPKEDAFNGMCGNSNLTFNVSYDYTNHSDYKYYDDNSNVYPYMNYSDDINHNDVSAYVNVNNNRDLSESYGTITTIKNKYNQGYENGRAYYYANNRIFKNIEITSVSGSLCFANYPDDIWNTSKNNEKYFSFSGKNDVIFSVFDNGLVRWEKGSGSGWSHYDNLYSTSYYSFFSDEQ